MNLLLQKSQWNRDHIFPKKSQQRRSMFHAKAQCWNWGIALVERKFQRPSTKFLIDPSLAAKEHKGFRFPLAREQFTAQWSSSKSSSTLDIHFVAKKWEWVIRRNKYISILYRFVSVGQLWQLDQLHVLSRGGMSRISRIWLAAEAKIPHHPDQEKSLLTARGMTWTQFSGVRFRDFRKKPTAPQRFRSPLSARCRKKKEYPWCWELGCSITKIFRQTGSLKTQEGWLELYETVKANRLIHAKLPYPAFKSPTQPKYCKHQIEYQLHREKERKSEQQKRYRM